MNQGQLFIISAPSGTGKTSLVSALLQRMDNLKLSVSHTTRPRRSKEIPNQSYCFISPTEFFEKKAQGAFMEYAQVFEHWYGTAQQQVEDTLHQGTDVILEIDWQGAEQVMSKIPCISIFILPPSIDVLSQRLSSRAQDSPTVIEKRLAGAREELSHYSNYDYLIWNHDFEMALNQLSAIVTACRLKTNRVIARDEIQLKALAPDAP